MVLSDDLEYYESEEEYRLGRPAKGAVHLDVSYCPNPRIEGNDQHEFTVHALPFQFTCRAESRADMLAWIDCIQSRLGI